MFLKLIRQLTQLKPYERLPRWTGYSVDFDPKTMQVDEQLLIQSGLVRDTRAARALLEQRNITVYDMDLRLPKARPNIKRRFRMWLMRLCGETPTDRVLAEYFRELQDMEEGFDL